MKYLLNVPKYPCRTLYWYTINIHVLAQHISKHVWNQRTVFISFCPVWEYFTYSIDLGTSSLQVLVYRHPLFQIKASCMILDLICIGVMYRYWSEMHTPTDYLNIRIKSDFMCLTFFKRSFYMDPLEFHKSCHFASNFV